MKREDIIKIRKDNRYSQKALAKILGVSLSMYQKIEYGLRTPSKKFVESFKQFFLLEEQ